MEQVFVYGTLTDPAQVAALLEEGPDGYGFVDEATLEGFRRVEGRYPTLVPGDAVDGRLLAVDESTLERLDRYEGVDSGLYVRVAVPRADGGRVWVYVGDPSRLEIDVDPWTDDRSLTGSVRGYIESTDTVVRSHE